MMETSTFKSEDNQHPKICSHCAIPFIEEELMQDLESTIKTSSSSSREFLLQALSSIFRLNYLNPFDVQDDEEELDNFELCQNCTQVLVNLHQLYNNFIQLGKLECYLDKKLQQLERIINRHQEKTINCDLISPPLQQKSSVLHAEEKESSSSENNCKNNSHSSKILLDGREPIILLKKLPVKYLQQIENSKSPSEEDENYPESFPEVKMEVEDDFPMDDDYSPPSSPQESDYDEKPIKKKKQSTQNLRFSSRQKTLRKSSSSPMKIPKLEPIKIKLNPKKKSTPLKKSKLKKKTIRDGPRMEMYLIKKSNFANPCWYCKKHFENLDLCIQHTQEAHLPKMEYTESPIICPRCSRICNGSICLKKHKVKCEALVPVGVTLPKHLQCHLCPGLFALNSQLERHMKIHTDQRPFACDECPYRAKCPRSLSHHRLNIHIDDSNEPKIKCDECEAFLKNERYLKIHKFNMHNPEGHQKYLKVKEAVKAKTKAQRVNVPPPVTLCKDCNVDFFSRLSLFNHREKVHGDNMGKEHGCEKCGKYFTHLYSLNAHMTKVHSEERRFICDQCGKGFKCSNNLSTHVTHVHTEEGRLKYNQEMRERNQRLKMRARQLASIPNSN